MVSHFSIVEPNLKQVFFAKSRLSSLQDSTHNGIKDLFLYFFITILKNNQIEFTNLKCQKAGSSYLSHFFNRFEDCLDYYSLFKMHDYKLKRYTGVL